MKVAVISSSPFIKNENSYAAYSPYVKELEIWAKYSDEIAFMCPIWIEDKGLLISPIPFAVSKMFTAREFNLKTPRNFAKAIRYSFWNFHKIIQSMIWADHIHLRCPGNIGLMGCLVQIFFPHTTKTVKYAGNWDPKASQPISYRLQRWIISNTFLTRNMKVLVYGEWDGSTKNIKSFFTASYPESAKIPVFPRLLDDTISFIYVGTFSPGKRPLYAVKCVEMLYRRGYQVHLSLYGNGSEKDILKEYISTNNLEDIIQIKGNHPQEIIKKAYQKSHFVILPSESEGWPKVIAEGMFWGCLPIATKVSCVPNMLDNGRRGMLLTMNLITDVNKIESLIGDQEFYNDKVRKSILWSRKYTLDLFEIEIKALLGS